MAFSREELEKIFVRENSVLAPEQFEVLYDVSRRSGESLERILVAKNYITEQFALEVISRHLGIDWVDLENEATRRDILALLPEKFCRDNHVIPFGKLRGQLKLAVSEYDTEVIEKAEGITTFKVIPYLASPYAIKKELFAYREGIEEEVKTIIQKKLKTLTAGEPSGEAIVPLLNTVLDHAVWARASDIHIEPLEDAVVIRYRIDGLLRDVVFLPRSIFAGIITRVKILAALKIDEHRIPQDGRFSLDVEGERIDFRVSTVPTIFGEKVALRVLIKGGRLMALEELGISAAHLEIIERNIRKPYGMILVTGPTGSGKTTSLYSMLHAIAEEKVSIVNISTIEDPIEYSIRRINQIQINPRVGLTFDIGVRAILRQDPDVVMVGEIRDLETAKAAVQGTLIGRLILSSLHTNDAPGAAVRLLDIGIEPYLVSSTLSLVIAQRLVRKICRSCIESVRVSEDNIKKISSVFDLDSATALLQKKGVLAKTKDPLRKIRFYRGKGCPTCSSTGYRGRIGLFEILEVTPALRKLISQRSDTIAIREQAIRDGMETMFQDGFEKVILGSTTLEEVFGATAV